MSNTISHEQFGFTLVMLARKWRRAIDKELGASGLTEATWAPLIQLNRAGDGITQTELAHRIGLDTSSLVRLLDLLVSKGMIERKVSPEDRRARLIYLTAMGNAEALRINAHITTIEKELLSNISSDELQLALKLFEQISVNTQVILERE